jgi:hypothetical protein
LKIENKQLNINVVLPNISGKTVKESLEIEPIQIIANAVVQPIFMPSFSFQISRSSYRELDTETSKPIPVDCFGNTITSANYYKVPCPCYDSRKKWDINDRRCVCSGNQGGGEGTCFCQNQLYVYDPSQKSCVCPINTIPCTGGTVDPTSCTCRCSDPLKIIVNGTCSCKPNFTTSANGTCVPNSCTNGMHWVSTGSDGQCTCPNGSSIVNGECKCNDSNFTINNTTKSCVPPDCDAGTWTTNTKNPTLSGCKCVANGTNNNEGKCSCNSGYSKVVSSSGTPQCLCSNFLQKSLGETTQLKTATSFNPAQDKFFVCGSSPYAPDPKRRMSMGNFNHTTCSCSCVSGAVLGAGGECSCPFGTETVGTTNSGVCKPKCGANGTMQQDGSCSCNDGYTFESNFNFRGCQCTPKPCASNQKWDYSSCSCKCPNGLVWDSVNQTCGCNRENWIVNSLSLGSNGWTASCGCNTKTTCTNGKAFNASTCNCECPANTVASGQGCTCEPGRKMENGQCVCDTTLPTNKGSWSVNPSNCTLTCPFQTMPNGWCVKDTNFCSTLCGGVTGDGICTGCPSE